MNEVAGNNSSLPVDDACQDRILTGVSRTFALTIPRLPEPLRRVVANAYLLCRIADTVEDETALDAAQKRNFHDQFVRVVAGDADAGSFGRAMTPLLVGSTTAAERELVDRTSSVIRITRSLPPAQQDILQRCIAIMCAGMPRFERNSDIGGLPDLQALDAYCYTVAGVVGETLTALFCDYSAAIAQQRRAMTGLDISFGQALQMTNILKDFWEDRARGACWLPRDMFRRTGIALEAVDSDRLQPGFTRAYVELIGITHAHLRNAFTYTLLIPARETGIRSFCLIALGLAAGTLQRLYHNPTFTAGSEVKVSRRVVRHTLATSRLFAGHDRLLTNWFRRLTRQLPLQSIAIDSPVVNIPGHSR